MKPLFCYLTKLVFSTSLMMALGLLLAILTGHIPPASADDDDDDWRRLHEDVEAGRIQPLSQILDNLARDWVGQVIDVDLEDDDGRRLYEIELLGPQGQVVEVEVDAVSGELLGIEGSNINGMKRQ